MRGLLHTPPSQLRRSTVAESDSHPGPVLPQLLEVHYNNPSGTAGIKDSTGYEVRPEHRDACISQPSRR
jgi:hypothetical protein